MNPSMSSDRANPVRSRRTFFRARPCEVNKLLRNAKMAVSRASSKSARSTSASRASHALEVDSAKLKMEREGYLFVDLRSRKEFDDEHIVKPPKQTFNVPIDDDGADNDIIEKILVERFKTKTGKLLLVSKDGTKGLVLAEKMREDYGYTDCFGVIGGYDGWMVKWTPSGRKRPPAGRFVATGRESLKSGLDLDPAVAKTYEENWGEPEKSLPENYLGSKGEKKM